MQLVDRIEKRRFVGREFLLWLWFESELFDATLSTRAHGSFGLWLEKKLNLSAGKEKTSIASVAPGLTRQAKAALLAGQLPDSAGIRIALRDDETGFMFKAERMAVGGLKLRPPSDDDRAETDALTQMAPGRGKPNKRSGKAKRDRDDEAHEAFYERMQLTEEFEGLLETLYSDFKSLRLSAAWEATVVPLLRAWANGEVLDGDAYTGLRFPERAAARGLDDDARKNAAPSEPAVERRAAKPGDTQERGDAELDEAELSREELGRSEPRDDAELSRIERSAAELSPRELEGATRDDAERLRAEHDDATSEERVDATLVRAERDDAELSGTKRSSTKRDDAERSGTKRGGSGTKRSNAKLDNAELRGAQLDAK